ncbi:Hypp2988 [Branchiostoma lanceolatum]|uniref:Hypp2988 protein n=1 Tax=Branchiostoma lanceolatum TaxID=7740 RepID=A0A8J9ZX35_BRALA|nr:Hypp2988 [Branchiostoma lanceolatum]
MLAAQACLVAMVAQIEQEQLRGSHSQEYIYCRGVLKERGDFKELGRLLKERGVFKELGRLLKERGVFKELGRLLKEPGVFKELGRLLKEPGVFKEQGRLLSVLRSNVVLLVCAAEDRMLQTIRVP